MKIQVEDIHATCQRSRKKLHEYLAQVVKHSQRDQIGQRWVLPTSLRIRRAEKPERIMK